MTSHLVPHLDVNTTNLLLVSGISPRMHWRDIKRTISKDCGRVDFIETFEAWLGSRINYIILQFRSSEGRRRFTREMSRSWYERCFRDTPIYEETVRTPRDRERFFERVKEVTRVDLLSCQGIPPRRWAITGKSPRREKSTSHSFRRSSSSSYRRKSSELVSDRASGSGRRSKYHLDSTTIDESHSFRHSSPFHRRKSSEVVSGRTSGRDRRSKHRLDSTAIDESHTSREAVGDAEKSYREEESAGGGATVVNSSSARKTDEDDPMTGEGRYRFMEDEILLI